MRSVNKVIIIGNVTRDPEIRKTQSGQTVCTFGLATNREWITSDGRKKSSAEYHEVVAWARLSEICEKYVRKGKLLYVEGYLKTRSWDTPEGIRKFKTEVVIQDMIMLEKRRDGEEADLEVSQAIADEGGFEGENSPEGEDHFEPTPSPEPKSIPVEDKPKSEKRDDIIDADLGL
ncbi:MAG: single-stranded DNA-binding protein [Candidatus Gracilibacteria bacterium]